MEEQVQRVMENYRHHTDPLDKYVFLTGLADRNVTLFYRVLMENLLEMTPVMYTPTVGHACQKFGHIYRKNRGMYLTMRHKGRMSEVLGNWPKDDVDIIVISDGSRITRPAPCRSCWTLALITKSSSTTPFISA